MAASGDNFTYTQRWGDRVFTLSAEEGQLTGSLNDRKCFTCSSGVRVVTDLDGKVLEMVGIAPGEQQVRLQAGSEQWECEVASNQVIQVGRGKAELVRAAPFDYPYRPQDE